MVKQIKYVAILLLAGLLACKNNNKSEWAIFSSGPGAFSVNMPVKPELTQKTEVTPFGKQVVHFVTWKPSAVSISKFKLFQISYTDCPQTVVADTIMTQVMLDSSIKMAKQEFSEKELSVENIELNGYPGRAFIYEAKGNTVVIVKQCITNNRRYQLTCITRGNMGTNPEVANFFDSFQALK
jgi:hypothetical protein